MTGPTGGEWVHTVATARDVPTRCDKCGVLTTTGIWQYFVGLVSHARVCDACADAATNDNTDPKEVTMSSTPDNTAGVTPALVAEVALALEGAHEDWVQGRATSPDTTDYVLITERIVEERMGPEYMWLSDEGTTLAAAITTRDTVAEDLYEAQCAGKLGEWAEMAEWLIGAVTVGPEGDDYPQGERS